MKNRDGMVTSILKDQGDGWYFLTENGQDAAIQKVEDGKYWAEYDEADDRGYLYEVQIWNTREDPWFHSLEEAETGVREFLRRKFTVNGEARACH